MSTGNANEPKTKKMNSQSGAAGCGIGDDDDDEEDDVGDYDDTRSSRRILMNRIGHQAHLFVRPLTGRVQLAHQNLKSKKYKPA